MRPKELDGLLFRLQLSVNAVNIVPQLSALPIEFAACRLEFTTMRVERRRAR